TKPIPSQEHYSHCARLSLPTRRSSDLFKRDAKNGGAWMNSFVTQSHLLDRKPVIINVANLPKPAEGEPALISFDNVVTMFHEMGHAMHGMLSEVKYPSQGGTSVPRDF